MSVSLAARDDTAKSPITIAKENSGQRAKSKNASTNKNAHTGNEEKLVAKDEHSKLIREIIKYLQRQHYAKQKIDDRLSARLLKNYINAIDGGKLFFHQGHIKQFQRFENDLDEALRSGDMSLAFTIFNVYKTQAIKRLNAVLANLYKRIDTLDFKLDEQLETDSDKMLWAGGQKELDDRWRMYIKQQTLNLKLLDKAQPAIVKLMRKRFKNQLRSVKQINANDVFSIYANTLTRLYDPHTAYLLPHNSENFQINMSLSLEGIGAVLERDGDYIKVVRIVPAGPADKQGELQPADYIIGVGEGEKGEIIDVLGWRLDEVVEMIRGPSDSLVRLQVLPSEKVAEGQSKVVLIKRGKVKLEDQAASKQIIELDDENGELRRIGIIDIPIFYTDFAAIQRRDPNYRSTTRDVSKLLLELIEAEVDGVIIDLRNNGGGSLQEANALTGLFVSIGPTVQIKTANNRIIRQGKRKKSNYYSGPLAILINRLSASASEIFAGAMQDYKRGVIIGNTSFGKGTVQTLIGLSSGQMKLTEAAFSRISGESNQHRGIIPDVVFPPIYNSDKIGESSLDNALPWDKIPRVRHHYYHPIGKTLKQLRYNHQQRVEKNPDFIYMRDYFALNKANQEQTVISLNYEKRKQKTKETERQFKALDNQRRVAKGLDPLEEETEDQKDLKEKDQEQLATSSSATITAQSASTASAQPSTTTLLADSTKQSQDKDKDSEDEEADPLLYEAALILQDSLDIFSDTSPVH